MYLPVQDPKLVSYEDLPTAPEYIYESQLSVMVTGIDDWVWAAYCLVDVYFKGQEHCENVEYYYDARERKLRKDPHSCGKHPADLPIWDPREYFLRAFSARMEQVREEWTNSVTLLINQIEPYVCVRKRAT